MNKLSQESLKVYRNLTRIINKFPESLQQKLRYNLKEAYDINRFLLINHRIQEDELGIILEKSNDFYSKLLSMSKNKELFDELFKPSQIIQDSTNTYKYSSIRYATPKSINVDSYYNNNNINRIINNNYNNYNNYSNNNNYNNVDNNNNNNNNNNGIPDYNQFDNQFHNQTNFNNVFHFNNGNKKYNKKNNKKNNNDIIDKKEMFKKDKFKNYTVPRKTKNKNN